ncbi:MAG: amidohydrolase family protein [Gemmatimonadota bacterium]
MRINAHAHIFNLQTVLTDEALAIMVNRVRKLGVPDYIADAVEAILQRQLDHPEYLNEDELLARFVRAIADSSAFGHAPELPLDVRVLSGDRSDLGVRALRATLNRISDAVAADRGAGKSPWDVFEALRVALQPDIPRVAGKLLSHMGPDDAIVALMMDITTSAEGERDRLNFGRQIRGTQEAVLAHPGRVLPFVAVNPLRSNHFELMRSAILEQGFLGVKLYPSLGYQMTTAKMARVLDFCREHDVPITIHTTTTGFNRDNATAQFCNPRHWKDLLVDDDPLRVCFAHCGGWGGFCGQDQDQSEWADRILAFMDRHPGIYADLSYHVDQMRDPAAEAAYFHRRRRLLELLRGAPGRGAVRRDRPGQPIGVPGAAAGRRTGPAERGSAPDVAGGAGRRGGGVARRMGEERERRVVGGHPAGHPLVAEQRCAPGDVQLSAGPASRDRPGQ